MPAAAQHEILVPAAPTGPEKDSDEWNINIRDEKHAALVTGGIQELGTAAPHSLADLGMNVAVMHLGGGDSADAFDTETGMPVFEWGVAD
ncbi:hypothetical protein SAMN05444398_1011036 [Roseovarius pacificus]|uniref:Uncharacterized protein n=1 Tax=Roseovarius pacificus TaxID=337701 RepID=A0A1M6YU65_9RHOB|nr:hypothetical protein [Roseovarius pacificus]GGO50369.1 hypothetical protein GCM10011315_00970 [Roseovarius pacificus]SHL21788.1 hypothetical protein SAMN05444398_1011036 [Roseovarius pacificus]